MDTAAPRVFTSILRKALRRTEMQADRKVLDKKSTWLLEHFLVLALPASVWQAFLLSSLTDAGRSRTMAIPWNPSARRLLDRAMKVLHSRSLMERLLTVSTQRQSDTSLARLCLLLVSYGVQSGDHSVTQTVPYEQWIALADHFGIWRLRYLLQDAWLRAEDPVQYATLEELLQRQERVHHRLFADIQLLLRHVLDAENLESVRIRFRRKNIGGIAEKMRLKGKNLNHITDIFGFQLITRLTRDCYVVRQILHRLWRPFPEQEADFIAHPKPNGYRSLHTTVLCLRGIPVEFQIRTDTMDWVAKYGPAAHALYKATTKLQR